MMKTSLTTFECSATLQANLCTYFLSSILLEIDCETFAQRLENLFVKNCEKHFICKEDVEICSV